MSIVVRDNSVLCFLRREGTQIMTDAPVVNDPEVVPMSLGARMKSYEDKMEMRLDPSLPFIIRLDGHSFSTFTRGFKKPFDDVISDAMIATAGDLVQYFSARSAFVASDEISLVFAAIVDQKETNAIFNGRVVKVSTLAAGYCSARFNHHLALLCPVDHPCREKCTAGNTFFDARVFSLPSTMEVFNNIFWRSAHDTTRNSKSMFGQAVLPHKSLQNLTSNQIIEKVLAEKGLNWEDLPGHHKYGSIIKKETFMADFTHPKTGEAIQARRHRLVTRSLRFTKWSQEEENTLMAKYWNEV
ncbi:hypothetical protein PROFUN_12573 [Planoprotostelium fungivorum]|uniref:tRNAHis guanylyltransferase catalytic domain-containing protein n=1 Tax=Planoprotostelium fungivorum TaxID=1890364 RepID=A0A2P6N6U3_9EUKA|nr:hypothetical protein PROFUN_12573 [Planoprotostelium fungivorum]